MASRLRPTSSLTLTVEEAKVEKRSQRNQWLPRGLCSVEVEEEFPEAKTC